MSEILDKLFQILTILSDGGPKAIVAILFIGIVLMAFANYFIVKFIVTFIKEQNASRDSLLAEKDAVIKERINKLEELVQQYNKAQNDSTEAIRKLESVIHEMKMILEFFLNNNTKLRK